MVSDCDLNTTSDHQIFKEKMSRDKLYQNQDKLLKEGQLRHWLKKQGKTHLLDFDEQERTQLKKYFEALDPTHSGGIGIEQIAEPLISLGIAQNREEVQNIIASVDSDNSGQIEFKEFLKIIKNGSPNQKNVIFDFFKNMINGRLGNGQISKVLPFSLIVSTMRRRKFIDAIMSAEQKVKQEGECVMKAYQQMLMEKKRIKKFEQKI